MIRSLYFTLCVLLIAVGLAPATSAQTATLLKDINPTGSSNPAGATRMLNDWGQPDLSRQEFAVYGGLAYFQADDGTHGAELWRTDGTPGGTVLVQDLHPSGPSSPQSFVVLADGVYFTAEDATGEGVWRATSGGVTLEERFDDVGGLFKAGNRIYFAADDGVDGREVWMIPAGGDARLVFETVPGTGTNLSSQVWFYPGKDYVGAEDDVYFTLDQGNGPTIWRTRGTEASTVSLAIGSVSGGTEVYPANTGSYFLSGNHVYFIGDGPDDGGTYRNQQLWRTTGDPTSTEFVLHVEEEGRTVPLNDIHGEVNGRLLLTSGNFSSQRFFTYSPSGESLTSPSIGEGAEHFEQYDGAVYFGAASAPGFVSDTRGALYRTTGATTVKVTDVDPTSGGAIRELTSVGAQLVFSGTDGSFSDYELWIGDGTDAGTQMVEVNSGGPGEVRFLTPFEGGLLFRANDGTHGTELWKVEASVLPVEFAGMEARADGDRVVLAWETAAEIDNAFFRVEHAREGEPFAPLGVVEGRGSTSTATAYRYRTPRLDPGTYRLRLRQVDLDGSVSYSPVVTVEVQGEAQFTLAGVAPNPVRTTTTLRYTIPRPGPVSVRVYDVLGRAVATLVDQEQAAGPHTVTFDATGLPGGVYFYRLQAAQQSLTGQMVLAR